jgi:hypothetical protein
MSDFLAFDAFDDLDATDDPFGLVPEDGGMTGLDDASALTEPVGAELVVEEFWVQEASAVTSDGGGEASEAAAVPADLPLADPFVEAGIGAAAAALGGLVGELLRRRSPTDPSDEAAAVPRRGRWARGRPRR